MKIFFGTLAVLTPFFGLMVELNEGLPIWWQLLFWGVMVAAAAGWYKLYQLAGGRFRLRDLIDPDLRGDS